MRRRVPPSGADAASGPHLDRSRPDAELSSQRSGGRAPSPNNRKPTARRATITQWLGPCQHRRFPHRQRGEGKARRMRGSAVKDRFRRSKLVASIQLRFAVGDARPGPVSHLSTRMLAAPKCAARSCRQDRRHRASAESGRTQRDAAVKSGHRRDVRAAAKGRAGGARSDWSFRKERGRQGGDFAGPALLSSRDDADALGMVNLGQSKRRSCDMAGPLPHRHQVPRAGALRTSAGQGCLSP